jgi:CRP-like cAMP-binding protein
MQRRVSAGEMVFHEGDTPDVAYMIISGRIEIFRESVTGERQHLTILETGQMFGEIGVMDHAPRSASARALMDTVLGIVSLDEE